MHLNTAVNRAVTLSSVLAPLILSIYCGNVLADHNHKSGAKTCYVDKIHYTNKGAYVVDFELYYVRGTKQNKYSWDKNGNLEVELSILESHTVNLANWEDQANLPAGLPLTWLRDGDEVWLKLYFVLGEEKSCHKNDHKLVYKKGVNKTMKFWSKGTTLDGNRCRYDGNMDDHCDTGE